MYFKTELILVFELLKKVVKEYVLKTNEKNYSTKLIISEQESIQAFLG